MVKPTPGPWHVDQQCPTRILHQWPNGTAEVATAKMRGRGGQAVAGRTAAANAALIAAAPDLLAACKAAYVWVAVATAPEPHRSAESVRNAERAFALLQAAIAKAGSEP